MTEWLTFLGGLDAKEHALLALAAQGVSYGSNGERRGEFVVSLADRLRSLQLSGELGFRFGPRPHFPFSSINVVYGNFFRSTGFTKYGAGWRIPSCCRAPEFS